ncbi:helix-turn-helix domain-containing protein [Sedimentisphaera salicampi]|uniref:helix-turn-helix domain-containing protein n=1 Tax=Sedimentisphaera salicampi TaxID=1941349 RepID=UPI000B9A93B3|nr:AraC family transcriptional regulator [Sedimentisphaera salicampi]OXU14017.1 Xylose operon regulatory protein [Sedimentisphaera salicampi]
MVSIENQYHYLPINDKSISWDIYLTGIGEATISAGSAYPPCGHPDLYNFNWESGRVLPEYQIVFISQGRGVFESSAAGQAEVVPGTMLILFPEVWHRYRPLRDTGWKENWISINGEYLYKLANRNYISPGNSVLHLETSDEIVKIYERMWEVLAGQQMQNSYRLSAMAMEILSFSIDHKDEFSPADEFIRTVGGDKNVFKDRLLSEAMHYIWSHSHRNMSVDDVAANLPVTRRTLERKFDSLLGTSIGKQINYCRVERAKKMLRSTTLPVSHIALAAGFSGADRMCKVFHKYLSQTPGEFRIAARSPGTHRQNDSQQNKYS